jgi:hypothetical protein
MTIEYHPRSLETLLNSPQREKRLRNREGFAVYYDPQNNIVAEPIWGAVSDVYRQAVLFDNSNPDHTVKLYENCCGQTGIPERLPGKGELQ